MKSIINLWRWLGKPYREFFLWGLDFYRHKILGYPNEFADMKRLMGRTNINIVDGGANTGSYTTWFRQYFYDSIIYAFEPLEHLKLKRQLRHIDRVEIFNCALGATEGTLKFNPVHQWVCRDIVKENIGDGIVHKEITVPMRSLDSLSEHFDIIKLDLEGYELEALKGATKKLGMVKIVLVEVYFIEYFKGQPLFNDIVEFLKKYDFKLYNLYNLNRGQVKHADALFVKERTKVE